MTDQTVRHIVLDRTTARPAAYRGVGSEIVRWISRAYLRLAGWRVQGDWPGIGTAVLLAAPHTSNWDGLNMLAVAGHYRVKLRWMGKASLAKGALGPLMLRAGLVPVDRSGGRDLVEQSAQALRQADGMILAVAPEGTRSSVTRWRTGFYRIAEAADAPIIISVLDYGAKTATLSGVLTPSGDYEADLALIASHYDGVRGRRAESFSVGD